MQLKSALRWSLYDRALALLPFLLGIGIVAGGIWLGAGAFLSELAFGDPSDAGQPSSVPLIVGGFVLGLLVWQLGRSAVRHHTMRKALENQIDELVDEERIASTAASKVDDRIADVETDVQQVSRKTTRIEQQVRGDELGSDEFGSDAESSVGGAEPAGAAAAGGAAADSTDDETGVAPTDGATASTEATGSDATDADDEPSAAAAESAAAGTEERAATESDAGDDGETADSAESTSDDESGADSESDDGFEWEGDDDDGEYYRNS